MPQQTTLFTSHFFHLEQIKEGVYAAIVKPGTGALGNAGFVDLGDEVLVFDTFLTPQAAHDLRQVVEQVVGKPINYVVNSHYHGDHVGGNQVFADATIISTARTRDLIIEKNSIHDLEEDIKQYAAFLQKREAAANAEPNERKRQDMLLDISDKKVLLTALPQFRLTAPHVTFEHRLVIHGSQRSVELITYGGGHTDSDSLLYLPDEKLAFLGDLVLVDATPFLGAGHPEAWLDILQQIKQLDLQTIIPGHGTVGTAAHIAQTEQYIHFILQMLRDAKTANRSVDEVASADVPAPYAEWEASMVYEWNIRGLWDRI